VKIMLIALVLAFAAPAAARAGDDVLAGQVVCSTCWSEAERPKVPYGNEADVACAQQCAEQGIPRALAVAAPGGKFELVLLEAGTFPGGEKALLELVGARAEARGVIRTADGKRTMRLESLRVIATREETLKSAAGPRPAIPSLVLRDLAGFEQSLERLRGRIVVVNFWAAWCAPCGEEMPEFARVQSRYGPWGLQVVGAAADTPEAHETVEAFIRKAKVNFPIWLGATTASMSDFGLLPALPGTAVLDRDGKVIHALTGKVTEAALAAVLEPLLRPAATATARGPSTPSQVPP